MAPDERGPIAIVGMATVFPGASSLDSFWRNVVDGVDAISEVKPDRWDPVFYDPVHPSVDRFYCRRGGFVDSQAVLDPVALGIVPTAVDHTEPDQLLALALASCAVADSGGDVVARHRERVGVIVGRGGYLTPGVARLDQRVRTAEQLVTALGSLLPYLGEDELAAVKDAFVERLGPDRPEAAIDLVPNLAASRVANRLDLGGPAYTVDAACASSLVAVDLGVNELRSGRCDAVIVGGVHLCHDVTLWSVFTQLGALSRSQCIRPFDRRADGLLIGEGGGMVVLQRLEDARRSDARIYAVVRGTGVSSDGRSASLMRPSVEGQLQSLRRAWHDAGIDRSQIGLVEAHGTATAAGDLTEVETLRRFFGDDMGQGPIGLGSIKSMIGHAMPAAGIAGLVKAALAVYHGVLPPTLHCEEPLEGLTDSRFFPIAQADQWSARERPRTAGVNAFGFGGINAHVVLEQHGSNGVKATAAPPAPGATGSTGRARGTPSSAGEPGSASSGSSKVGDPLPTDPVMLLSAADTEDLLGQLGRGGETGPGEAPAPGGAPSGGPLRLAVFNPTPDRLDLARQIVSRTLPWRGRRDIWFSPKGLVSAGGLVAFAFPGVEPVFEPRVGDVARHFDLPMPDLVDSGASADNLEGLGRALIGVGRLLHAAVSELGLRPDLVAGQSIGEWSGMIATEIVPPGEVDSFISTIRPGSLEIPGVAFAALGCAVDVAERLIGSQQDLAVSHDNCPHQTIVCGTDGAVASLMSHARAQKVLAQLLPFRSGFHTQMFTPFLEPIRRAYDRLPLQPPQLPLWSATTCRPYPDDPEEIRSLALAHLVERVRLRELALALYEHGVRVFVQIGVGNLPALLDDTLTGRDVLTTLTNSPRHSGMNQLLRAMAACWVEGYDGIRFDRFASPSTSPVVGVPEDEARPAGSGRLRRLPLHTPLIRLPPLAGPTDPGRRLEHAAMGVGQPTAPGPGGADGRVSGLAAELQAVFDEVTGSIAEVVRAVQATTGQPTAPTIPPAPLRSTVHTRILSLETMPALADHCFYRQAPGWPSMADRFPVVPMTALIEMMIQSAAELVPDMVAVGIEQVRALRWLVVAPPVEVTIRVDELAGAPCRFRVVIDGYARAEVIFSTAYPAAPTPKTAPLFGDHPSPVTAPRLYEDRWMFHGVSYQGVRELGPLGDNGIDGVLEVTEAPGALLDNAGQLMGFWVMVEHEQDRLALPTAIDRITFHGPPPVPGDRVGARVRFSHVDQGLVRSDMELATPEQIWASVHGWEDRRFESDDAVWTQFVWPELSTLVEEGPGGWVLAREHWHSTGSRELMMRRYLGETERERYATHNPRAQRLHLLGRIAAKDAARRWLWEHGSGPMWPAEVELSNDEGGRPIMRVPGHDDLRVSIAHTPWVGVAMVREGADVGIDVEHIEPRSDGFTASAFYDREVELLGVSEAGCGRDEWLTRAWAAKEAVAKEIGTGLNGRPRDFVIEERRGPTMRVNDRWVHTVVQGDLAVAFTVADASAPGPTA